ncbi:MAG: hypothetical protein V4660_03365 [Pseudomonadota bacterium]
MKKLNIGNLEFNSEDIARKVENDIAFLVDRLRMLEQQKIPNAVVVQTYRDMLDSRYAVLAWLRFNNEAIHEKVASN